MTLDYAIELYTLCHKYYQRAHTSHYSLLKPVKYHKLLLGYHLGLGSYLSCLLSLKHVYYFISLFIIIIIMSHYHR
jgi:hypothetical protein